MDTQNLSQQLNMGQEQTGSQFFDDINSQLVEEELELFLPKDNQTKYDINSQLVEEELELSLPKGEQKKPAPDLQNRGDKEVIPPLNIPGRAGRKQIHNRLRIGKHVFLQNGSSHGQIMIRVRCQRAKHEIKCPAHGTIPLGSLDNLGPFNDDFQMVRRHSKLCESLASEEPVPPRQKRRQLIS